MRHAAFEARAMSQNSLTAECCKARVDHPVRRWHIVDLQARSEIGDLLQQDAPGANKNTLGPIDCWSTYRFLVGVSGSIRAEVANMPSAISVTMYITTSSFLLAAGIRGPQS